MQVLKALFKIRVNPCQKLLILSVTISSCGIASIRSHRTLI